MPRGLARPADLAAGRISKPALWAGLASFAVKAWQGWTRNGCPVFGSEAAPGPIDFIVGLLKNSKSKGLKRLEIRHLVEAANSGKLLKSRPQPAASGAGSGTASPFWRLSKSALSFAGAALAFGHGGRLGLGRRRARRIPAPRLMFQNHPLQQLAHGLLLMFRELADRLELSARSSPGPRSSPNTRSSSRTCSTLASPISASRVGCADPAS